MFWKIFFGVWLCSWKYHRKHIFCLLLTFSWLPKKYIISFIPQYRNTNKTQKKKISSNPVKLREEGRERGNWVRQEARSRDVVLRSRLGRRRDRDRRGAATIRPDQKGEGDCERERSAARTRRRDLVAAFVSRAFSLSFSLCAFVSSSLCVSQFRKWFEGKIKMEMILQDQRAYFTVNGNYFPFDLIFRTKQTPTFPENHFRNQFEAKTNGA